MVNPKNTFVFVVCGGEVYIDTLNIALRFLKVFSKSDVIVITDSSRNECPIQCEHIVDVRTDKAYTHHQASVFLKTSIHRYLDLDKGKYCYLDSDILAISDKADEVFLEEPEVIGFCADNITLDLFSPYAVNCGCYEKARQNEQHLLEAQSAYAKLLAEWEAFKKEHKGDVLDAIIAEANAKKSRNLFALSRFAIEKACPLCRKASFKSYSWDKKLKVWRNYKGEVILFPIVTYYEYIARKTGFTYVPEGNFWSEQSDHDACIPRCTHLHELIKKSNGCEISPDSWQHWNGGLFLFNRNSVEFLEYWHERTISIFKDADWKVRDQGTLAQTVWRFGLQNCRTIDSRFNFILDYYKPGLGLDGKGGFTKDNFASIIQPEMVHVYHRFGDEQWEVWQYLKAFGKSKGVSFDE